MNVLELMPALVTLKKPGRNWTDTTLAPDTLAFMPKALPTNIIPRRWLTDA